MRTSTLTLRIIRRLIRPFTPVFQTRRRWRIITTSVSSRITKQISTIIRTLHRTRRSFITTTMTMSIIRKFRTISISMTSRQFTHLLRRTNRTLLSQRITKRRNRQINMTHLLSFRFNSRFRRISSSTRTRMATIRNSSRIFFSTLTNTTNSRTTSLLRQLTRFCNRGIIIRRTTSQFTHRRINNRKLRRHIKRQVTISSTTQLTLFIRRHRQIRINLTTRNFRCNNNQNITISHQLFVRRNTRITTFVVRHGNYTIIFKRRITNITQQLFLQTTRRVTLRRISTRFNRRHRFFQRLSTFNSRLHAQNFNSLRGQTSRLTFRHILVGTISGIPIGLRMIQPRLKPRARAQVAYTRVVRHSKGARHPMIVRDILRRLRVINQNLFNRFSSRLTQQGTRILRRLRNTTQLIHNFRRQFQQSIRGRFTQRLLFIRTSTDTNTTNSFRFTRTPNLSNRNRRHSKKIRQAIKQTTTRNFMASSSSFKRQSSQLRRTIRTTLDRCQARNARLFNRNRNSL